ncbi:MAG: exodeoxyribonuclease V subunit gamma, partial [Firmicutes bacterium]|nr:exodeoxyribonuclease V subunit gamma [Bacillota bacterium]
RHILVDEYQDTNRCQYRLVQLLAGKSGNLFVVGDPDQSIYRWRGADINNILDFTDDYPRCREIQLNRNYRSTQNILDVANSVIAHNKRRKEKRLDTENGSGERVIFRFSETDREEAAFVIRTIARLVEQGDYRYADCAVLYRTHGLSRLFEDECTRFHIPYRVYGGMKFYDRKEVRDLYAYLRLAANPNDAEALQRIYNVPRRGIGATTWQKVQEAAAASGQPLYAVLAQAAQLEGVSAATGKKLTSLHQLLASFAEFAAADATISDLLEKIWQESGYHDMLREQENYQEKLEIIEQLFDVAADFDASWAEMQALMEEGEFDTPLSAFLSQLALATDMDDEHQAESFVTLMTMHAAKGLEYPVVFIVGMEEGGFPHERALTGVDDSEMEEERRLCYVAMTRAKERLFLSAAGRRLIWGSLQNRLVSSFIDEVGEGLLDKQGFITRARAEQSVEKRREVQTSIFTGRTYGSSGGSRPSAPAPTPARPVASAPQPAAKPAAPAAPIALGDKVLHGKFGEGTVVAVQGSGDDLMVTVAFPGQGIKTLMWRFAPMKKI